MAKNGKATVWRIRIQTGPNPSYQEHVYNRIAHLIIGEATYGTESIWVDVSDDGDKWGALNAEHKITIAMGWNYRSNYVQAMRPRD